MNTELITQQSLQCQVFISVFKFTYDDIIIKFYFVRQIYFAQTDNEEYLCRVILDRFEKISVRRFGLSEYRTSIGILDQPEVINFK